MSAVNDGGFAFPSPEWEDAHGNTAPQEYGMTLRDYFAAKAMQAFISRADIAQKLGEVKVADADYDDLIAGWAYESADAMLKARNQQ